MLSTDSESELQPTITQDAHRSRVDKYSELLLQVAVSVGPVFLGAFKPQRERHKARKAGFYLG